MTCFNVLLQSKAMTLMLGYTKIIRALITCAYELSGLKLRELDVFLKVTAYYSHVQNDSCMINFILVAKLMNFSRTKLYSTVQSIPKIAQLQKWHTATKQLLLKCQNIQVRKGYISVCNSNKPSDLDTQ